MRFLGDITYLLCLALSTQSTQAFREDFFPDPRTFQDYRPSPMINGGRPRLMLPSNVLGEINLKQRSGGGNGHLGATPRDSMADTIDEVAQEMKQDFKYGPMLEGTRMSPVRPMPLPSPPLPPMQFPPMGQFGPGQPMYYPMPIPIPYLMPIYVPHYPGLPPPRF